MIQKNLEIIHQIECFFDFETSWTRIIYGLPPMNLGRDAGYWTLTPDFRKYLEKLAYTECENVLRQAISR